MEGAVDPAVYRVGPGDIFAVTIATLNEAFQVPVTADGRLMLPDAGSVRVAGETLSAARSAALQALRAQYSNVAVDVTLAQPRQFYVHVAGAVSTPGRYLAMPVERVASVVALAFADTSRVPVRNPRFRPSLRDVTVEHADGTAQSVDLQRYLATGDRAYNPYLNDGDIVRVGAYDPATNSVFVSGAAPNPGAYPYRSGDTAADVLMLASGGTALRADSIRVTQAQSGRMEAYPLDMEALRQVALSRLDQVFVMEPDLLQGAVTVEGSVGYPGPYPITEGLTTLQDMVERAGGLEADALVRGAYLERYAPPTVPHTLDGALPFSDTPLPRLDADSLRTFLGLRLTDLDFLSRAYLADELRMQQRVALDLEAALQPGAEPLYLRIGDRLVIPKDEQTVRVVGQVARPGHVAVLPEGSIQAYLNAAGQTTAFAGPVYVIEAGTGRFLPASEASPQSGDIIFVDRLQDQGGGAALERIALEMERMDLERERMAYDERLRRNQFWVQVTAAVASVASAVGTYLIVRQNSN
ncbi:MAG: SLBB domain-containing protein [Bacteroidota bacterium]